MMDPYQNQRNQLNSGRNAELREHQPDVSGNEQSDNPDRNAAVSRNPQQEDRQPRYSGGFTVIPPNESRRRENKMIAEKEEEALQRWKEEHRVTSVHVNPEKLGGNATMAEAREKQFTNQHRSRLQKKLKQEEQDKRKRQEEEAEIKKMKDEQRQKTERLEERSRQEEQRRREQLRQDHLRTTDSFLQRFESRAPRLLAPGAAPHTSSRGEAVENKQIDKLVKSVRDVQLEHKRVNTAFLDKLEGRGRASENDVMREHVQEEERPRLASEDLRSQQPYPTTEQQVHLAHLNPDPEQSCSDWTEDDMEPEYDWALMKLMNSFPQCSKVFLEDILIQCNGNYEQACTLLN